MPLTPEQVQLYRQGLGIKTDNPVSTLPKDLKGEDLANHYMSLVPTPQQSDSSKKSDIYKSLTASDGRPSILSQTVKNTADIYSKAPKAIADEFVGPNAKPNLGTEPGDTGFAQNLLGGAARVGETVFAPFTGFSKAVTDEVANNFKDHPEAMNNPIVKGIIDVFNKHQDIVNQDMAAHPDATRNIGNAVSVITSVLAGLGLNESIPKFADMKSGVSEFVNPTQKSFAPPEKYLPIDQFSSTAPDTELISKWQELGKTDKVATYLKDIGWKENPDFKAPAAANPVVKAEELAPAANKVIENKAIRAITPEIKDVTPTERQALLDQGKLSPQTALKPSKVNLTPEEQAVAVKYADLLQGNSAIENYGNVANRVSEMDASIGSHLKDLNKSYDKVELRSAIENKVNGVAKPIMVSDKAWSKATTQLMDDFMNSIKGKKDWQLWEARKSFDTNIERAMNAFEGTPTAKKALGKAVRDAAQEFIDSRVPDGVYGDTMKTMHELLKMNESLGTKALKEMTRSEIANFMRKNPIVGGAMKKLGGVLKLGGLIELLH